MSDRLQAIWRRLRETETVAIVGAGAGIIGAATGFIAAVASVWSLHDQREAAAQEAEANKPIAVLRVNAGDQNASMAYLTIVNPGRTAFKFTEAIVRKPIGWVAVPLKQAPVAYEPQFQNAGVVVILDLTAFPQRASSFSTEVDQLFIVQNPKVMGDDRPNMQSGPSAHIPDNGIEMTLRGHSLSHESEAIEINVDAVQP